MAVPLTPRSSKNVVYLSNLPHDINSASLEDLFMEEAKIKVLSVEMLIKGGGASRLKTCGLAVIFLATPEDVQRALKMDGTEVLDRPMIVRLNKFEEDQANYVPPPPKVAAKVVLQPLAVSAV